MNSSFNSCIKTACYLRLYGSFAVSPPNVHSFHPSAFHFYNVTIPLHSLISLNISLFVFLVSSHSSFSTNLSLHVVHQICLFRISAVEATCLSCLSICLLFSLRLKEQLKHHRSGTRRFLVDNGCPRVK